MSKQCSLRQKGRRQVLKRSTQDQFDSPAGVVVAVVAIFDLQNLVSFDPLFDSSAALDLLAPVDTGFQSFGCKMVAVGDYAYLVDGLGVFHSCSATGLVSPGQHMVDEKQHWLLYHVGRVSVHVCQTVLAGHFVGDD